MYFFSYGPLCFCFRSFAKAIGCEITSLKACVKEKTVHEVLNAQSKIFDQLNYASMGPVVDGYFLPGMNFTKLKGKTKNKKIETGEYKKKKHREILWLESNAGSRMKLSQIVGLQTVWPTAQTSMFFPQLETRREEPRVRLLVKSLKSPNQHLLQKVSATFTTQK